MLENKITKKHKEMYSVYIASWLNIGGILNDVPCHYVASEKDECLFTRWLADEGLSFEEIDDICELITTGKYEFEHNARLFLEENLKKKKFKLFKRA